MFLYGMISGALPDFFFGLVLIFVFFFTLAWLPPPLGRTGFISPPPHHTGFYLIDSLIAGDAVPPFGAEAGDVERVGE